MKSGTMVPLNVYCDPPFEGLMIRGNTTWSHMGTSDHSPEGLEQLHRVARAIGLKREWFQDKKWHPHYDLFPGRRVAAIRLGVKAVGQREYVKLCSRNPVILKWIAEEEAEAREETFTLKG